MFVALSLASATAGDIALLVVASLILLAIVLALGALGLHMWRHHSEGDLKQGQFRLTTGSAPPTF